jgi:hypothetical protein
MIDIITKLLLLVIAVEATTEIITSSKLVSPLQNKWKLWTYPADRPPPGGIIHALMVFIDNLWSCGYCTSVWVSGFFALFAPKLFGNIIVNWLVLIFVLHRLSNWLHVVYELLRRGRVNSLDVMLRVTEDDDGTIGQGEDSTAATFGPERSESGGSE